MVKLNEISEQKFMALVIAELKPKCDNLNEIVARVYEKRKTYQVINAINFVRAAITKAKKLENAEIRTGIMIGTKDKKNSKAPIKAAFLVQNQKHMELVLWDMAVPYADGQEAALIFPAVMQVALTQNKNGGNVLERVMSFKKIATTEDLMEKLNKLKAITTPIGVRRPVKETYEYPVTVMEATIEGAGAILSSDYEADVREYWPVWVPDDKKTVTSHPALNLMLKTDDGATVWAKLTPRKHAKAFIDISDLEHACTDAMEEYEKPKDQASFVGDALCGKRVIIVGSVTGKDNNPKYGMTISMDLFAIFEIPQGSDAVTEAFEPQQVIEETSDADEPETPLEDETDQTIENETEGNDNDGSVDLFGNDVEQIKPSTEEIIPKKVEPVKEAVKAPTMEQPPTEKKTRGRPKKDAPPVEPVIEFDVLEEIKNKMLWKAGLMSGKKNIEEKKDYLRGLKVQENIIDTLKFPSWIMSVANTKGITIEQDIAVSLVKQAYEELTK